MNILIFTHEFAPFPGGVARYTYELAKAASALGHQVHVVAPDYGETRQALRDEESPFVIHRQPAGVYCSRSLPRMIGQVLRHIGRQAWDVIHAADLPYAIALGFVSRFKRLPFQCTAHGTDVLGVSSSGTAKLLVRGNPYALCTRVACNSEFTRGLLRARFPHLPVERSLVTYLGVAPYWSEACSGEEIAEARQLLGGSPATKTILTVARLEERKGHLLTIEALNLLWEKGARDFRYVIAGAPIEEAYHRRLRELADSAPFPIVLTGRLSEGQLRALYHLSHVFCMPSLEVPNRVEGFGLAYLEAAAQGLPAVAIATNAVPEVVKHGKTGLLLARADAGALGETLSQLLGDEARRAEMGVAATAWARTFTWQSCAERTFPSASLTSAERELPFAPEAGPMSAFAAVSKSS